MQTRRGHVGLVVILPHFHGWVHDMADHGDAHEEVAHPPLAPAMRPPLWGARAVRAAEALIPGLRSTSLLAKGPTRRIIRMVLMGVRRSRAVGIRGRARALPESPGVQVPLEPPLWPSASASFRPGLR